MKLDRDAITAKGTKGDDSFVTLLIRVQPRASRTAVEVRDGRLLVRVTSPPVESAANEAVREALADTLDLPRRAIRIAGGEKSRNKKIEISGVDERTVRARLAALGVTSP